MIKNATEARALAMINPVDNIVTTILERIEKVAGDDTLKPEARRYIHIKDFGFGSSQWYSNQPSPDSLHGRVMDRLRGLGFAVSIDAIESQFVDIYLVIKW